MGLERLCLAVRFISVGLFGFDWFLYFVSARHQQAFLDRCWEMPSQARREEESSGQVALNHFVAKRDPGLPLSKLFETLYLCSQGKAISGQIPVLRAEYNRIVSLNSVCVALVICTAQ